MNERTDERIADDLSALRKVTEREIPELRDTLNDARRRRKEPVAGHWKIGRKLMAQLEVARRRPAFAIGLAAVVTAVAVMVVPVSYQRVAGQDVVVSIAGGGLGPDQIGTIARDLKSRLGAGAVLVDAEAGGASTTWVLRASSPERSRAGAAGAAGAFVKELADKGLVVSLQVSPHVETVRSPVAAYAWDQMIQISLDGKSASQLESEIRQRLAEAGVTDAQVSVTDAPGGGHEVSMKVERQRVGDASTLPPEPAVPQVQFTKDGTPLAGGFTVRVKKQKVDGGPLTLVVDVTSDGKSATVQVPNADSKSDAEVAASIKSQLQLAGIAASVKVQDGRVEIDPVK